MDKNLSPVIEELEKSVSKESAVIRLEAFDSAGDDHKVRIVGNRDGFLRLGVEFLKAGVALRDPKRPDHVGVDLSYLLHPSSDVYIDWFELRDDVKRASPPRWTDWIKVVLGIIWMFFVWYGWKLKF